MTAVDASTNNPNTVRTTAMNQPKGKGKAGQFDPLMNGGANINANGGSGDDAININVNLYGNGGNHNDQDDANAQGQGIVEGEMDEPTWEKLPDIKLPPRPQMPPESKGPINVNTGSGDDKVIINGPVEGPVNVDSGSGDDTVIIGGQPAPAPGPGPAPGPDPDSGEPIAANEHGRVWGDPHFIGGDGGEYDVQGEAGKNYNLLSDKGLEFNGRFDGRGEGITVVGETGLTVTSEDGASKSQIGLTADGTATIDGEEMEAGKLYTLADGGTAKLDGNVLTTTTAEGYTIKQEFNGSNINADVYTGDNGVGNGQNPGGLLGQTFDADDVARNGKKGKGAQGEGAIDGKVQDYEVDSLMNSQVDDTAPTTPNGPINVDTGSGDDEVIINGPVNGPVNVDTGSGDDVVVIGPGEPAPGPAPGPDPDEAPVAANEEGRIEGDPHFYGPDGGKYDVQGEPGKIYNLMSDQGLEFRGRFDGWSDGTTVVGETGLTVGEGMNSDNINFRKDGTAQINGQLMEEGKEYELADGGTAKLENGELSVTTAEGYTISQTTHGSGDRSYINISVKSGEEGVDNGQMPDGLLGQTFDADNEARNGKTGRGAQGEGAIEGTVTDYERSALDPVNDNRGTDETAPENPEDLDLEAILAQLQELINQLLEFIDGGMGGLPIPLPETHTDTGSGDDEVEITSTGTHTVELGSGDDEAYVNLEDAESGSSATIEGGSGDDTVTLAGSEADYEVSYEDGYTVYTDQNGNAVRVADDVETVQFEGPIMVGDEETV